jgi:hypothetical protein
MSNLQAVAIPLAKRLISVKDDVSNNSVDRSYVKALANEVQSTKVSERLETYLITSDASHLEVSQAEAFKSVVYASSPVIGAPVMFNGEVVPSPSPGDESPIPLVMSRSLLFSEVLTMYWQDDPVERLDFSEGSQDRVRHAPLRLQWNGEEYELLGESLRKSFYWPVSIPLAEELVPWISRRAQDRTTMITGVRRQGLSVLSLTGFELNPSQVYDDGVDDLGVCVLEDSRLRSLNDEIGLVADPYQGTIWFQDGSFWKGTIQSETSSGRTAGFYGGLKRPAGANGPTSCTRASIMDSYTMVPWEASVNRQQTDFSNQELPVAVRLPSRDTFAKAALGFPPFIQQLNDQLISSCGQLVRRASVKGFAGKVAIGTTDEPVQFIISGPDVKDYVRTMVWLFNPTLPVHTSLMKVRVQFRRSSGPGSLIQLNVHESNYGWIEKWYMKMSGRDVDGDGAVLSNETGLLRQAHWPESITWHDTTQYKYNQDVDSEDKQTAIRVSTERVRLYSGRIGIYDKLARRIHRQDPNLLTWELRVQLSEAIQRSISAQKKNSGVDKYDGYSWLLKQLPEGADDWLFENVHDHIDELEVRIRAFLSNHQRNGQLEDVPDYGSLMEGLDDVAEEMPEHIDAVRDVLNLVQQIPKDAYHTFKEQGRQLWARHQADASEVQIQDVLSFITKAQHLWRTGSSTVDGDSISVGFNQKLMIIRTWARQLSERVSTRLLVGAMINHLSLNLLSHVMDIEDLVQLGLTNGFYLPISTENEPSVGMIGSRGSFAALISHPYYLDALSEGHKYRIEDIHILTGSSWSTRTTRREKQSTHILHVKEVRNVIA